MILDNINTSVQSDNWAPTADLTTLRDRLLDLFCQEAYKEGDFALSSGQHSSYYINSKPVTLHPQGALAIARLLLPWLQENTQAVAGLTLGADPIVSAISVVSAYEGCPIKALIVRKEAKGHGTRAYIEGPCLPEGANVVVLEDVVTTGQSALKAVDRLRDSGYKVEQIITLVDRHQGGSELYKSLGLKFQSMFSISEIKERYEQIHKNTTIK
jgi:orotate phosphoribosyltransferase